MPHAIPQTDSALYPHRLSTEFMLNHPVTCGREQQERHHYQPIPRRPCSSKSRFFYDIMTVYFNCKYFPLYTRELLETASSEFRLLGKTSHCLS